VRRGASAARPGTQRRAPDFPLGLLGVLLLLVVGSCEETVALDDDSTTSFFIQLEEGHPAYEYRDLIRKVAGWAAERDPVGSELLILSEGRPLFRGNWGELDRERQAPWKKNTICRLRSLTHPILATAILMLRKDGKLELSDPVERYLPEFDRERFGPMTIGELLSHTSGLSNVGTAQLLQHSGDLCSFVETIATRDVRAQLDHTQSFSEIGYNLLACVISRVSGHPIDEFLKRRIFTPLGMKDTHTTIRASDPWSERLASTYSLSPSGLGFRRIIDGEAEPSVSYFHAGRGIFSTALDYARFLRLWVNKGQVNGKSLLSSEEIALGHTLPEGVAPLPGSYSNAWELFGEAPLDPSLPAPFGHFGGDESVALVSPEKDLTFIYFTQSRGGDTARAFASAVSEIFRAKAP